MKIIDEHGNPIESPDLTLGRLVDDAEIVHHDAVAAVEPVTHYEYKVYPNGGRDRITVVDVPGVEGKEAWDETVERQRYILYTAEELAERKAQKERQDKIDRMPETVEQLQAENKILREKLEQAQSAQSDTDSLMVDQEYRMTLMELGVSE